MGGKSKSVGDRKKNHTKKKRKVRKNEKKEYLQ